MKSLLYSLLVQNSTRMVTIYISLKLIFFLVQLLASLYTHNTGLITESLHTLFDVLVLCVSLYGICASTSQHTNNKSSYHQSRIELLCAFVNCLCIIFISLFLLVESFHSLYEPAELYTSDMVLAVYGCTIDIFGLCIFRHNMYISDMCDISLVSNATTHNKSAHVVLRGSTAHELNMYSIYLHPLCDLGQHGAILLSTIIAHHYNIHTLHSLCTILVSCG